MACGENPKRVYRHAGRALHPHGQHGGLPRRVIQAESYRRKWDAWNKDHKGDPPEGTSTRVVGEVFARQRVRAEHCYRADEMAQMLDPRTSSASGSVPFHHAVESYKIADLLAKEGRRLGVGDWWGFKEEAMDGIQETPL